MKMQTLGWLIGLSAIASSFISCSQPPILCGAAHGGTPGTNEVGTPVGIGFAALYTQNGAAPMCATTTKYTTSVSFPPVYPDGATLDKVRGDVIGLETYHPAVTTDHGPEPDFTKTSVAVKTDGLGQLIKAKVARKATDASMDHKAYAYGEFQTSTPDDNGICKVSNLKPAEQDIPKAEAVPPDPDDPDDMGKPEQPPVSVKQEWKNLEVYVTSAAPGTQFSGDLTYTQDSCTMEYHVVGLWPVVGCDALTEAEDDYVGMPDDTKCCPNADPAVGRITGSGINPDFPVKCDPTLLICVLDTKDGKIPVLKPGWDQADGSPCKTKSETPK